MKRRKSKVAANAASLIAPERLDFWLKQRYNALFEGKHGVGKTSIIIDAFKRNKLRYVCLSGATMDPFIDFVGVPVKVKTDKGESVIDLLRPKYIQDANPQAIFIDEFNRSHKKVRNAVMELIQFKTINGQPISKDLKVIWTAINPDGEDGVYDTDRLDPAQRDRFHIQVEIPYLCDRPYFVKKYGAKVGNAAIEYWNNIPAELKDQISPRRLDYALTVLKDGGDARDVLPIDANVSALALAIKSGPVADTFNKLSDSELKKFFADETNYQRSVHTVLTVKRYNRMLEFFPSEKLAALFAKSSMVRRFTLRSLARLRAKSPFVNALTEIANAGQIRPTWVRKINKYLPKAKGAKVPKPIKTNLPARLPSGPIAKALASVLQGGKCNMKQLIAAASKAKGVAVPEAKVLAKLNTIRRWAGSNNIPYRVFGNGKHRMWSCQ